MIAKIVMMRMEKKKTVREADGAKRQRKVRLLKKQTKFTAKNVSLLLLTPIQK